MKRSHSGDSKVFADGYLIYAPDAQKVTNNPLKDFTPAENIVITAGDRKALFEAVLKKPTLLPYISTQTFSPLIAVDNSLKNNLYNQKLKLELTFDCSQTPSPAVVKLEISSLNKFAQETKQDSKDKTDVNGAPNKLDTLTVESTEILNFPGCAQEQDPETFVVPLNAYLIPQDRVLLYIRGIDSRYLTVAKLFADDQELPLTFLPKTILDNTSYKLLYSSKRKNQEITAYSTQVSKDFVVQIQKTNEGFDLSSPINQLMKQGALTNPFIIWTDKYNEIIKLVD